MTSPWGDPTSGIEILATTLRKLAKTDMEKKDLVAAVRKQHPDTTKKEIVRAAFYALTHCVDDDPAQAQRLHAFALTERAGDEEDATPLKKPSKKDRRKGRELRSQEAHH